MANKAYLGAGLMFFTDKTGSVKYITNQANITLNGILPISKLQRLSAGIQCGIAQHRWDVSLAKWEDQYNGSTYDPTIQGENIPSTNYTYGDFSAGVHWDYGKNQGYISSNDAFKIHTGIALYHLNKPKQSLFLDPTEKLYSKICFHGGGEFGIKNTNIQLVPSFLYLHQGPSNELIIGSYIKYVLKEDSKYTGYVKGVAVSMGLYFRAKDAIVPSVLLEFGRCAFGISYDVNTSKLKTVSNGKVGLEIMLKYRTPNPFFIRREPHQCFNGIYFHEQPFSYNTT